MTPQLPLPTFIIAGATRSGTTSLFRYLRDHPDVFVSAKKELSFFNQEAHYARGVDYYRSQFAGYAGQKAIGESTPLYMELKETNDPMTRIASTLPDVKIILSLREPFARLKSLYWKAFYQGRPREAELDFLLSACRYDVHLKNIFRQFPKERLRVLVFEEWVNDPSPALMDLHRFLGIEARTDSGLRIHNQLDEYKPGLAGKLARLAHKIGIGSSEGAFPQSSVIDQKAAQIHAALEPIIAETELLLGRSLQIWRTADRG